MRARNSILFWFRAGQEVGLGHWYRSLELARRLRRLSGCPIHFLVNPLDAPLSHHLREEGWSFFEEDSLADPSSQPAKLIEAKSIGTLIIDIKELDTHTVLHLKDLARVVSIGGSGPGRDRVHLRFDGMIPRNGYTSGFVGERLFYGPEYVILRDSFSALGKKEIRSRIQTLLVALGGDAGGYGMELARLLNAINPDWKIDVLAGPLSGEDKGPASPNVRLHRNLREPAKLMQRADLAIVNGGITTYEVLCVGTPAVIVPTVPEQRIAARAFSKAGAAYYTPEVDSILRSREAGIIESVLENVESAEIRLNYSRRGCELVDGKGADRIAKSILEDMKNRYKPTLNSSALINPK